MSEPAPMSVLDRQVFTDRMWKAVDRLTKPTRRVVHRDEDGLLADVLDVAQTRTTDELPRWLLRTATGMAARTGMVPCLWDQATEALTLSQQSDENSGGDKAERSITDVELMEIRSIISDTTNHELRNRQLERTGSVPDQLRRLAAHVMGQPDEDMSWWDYRFSQWMRLLDNKLADQRKPKPIRLRNSACPLCATKQVTIEGDYGPVVAPPIVIDFSDGMIRAATCEACGATWWRGDELNQLADLLHAADDGGHADVAGVA